MQIKPAADTDRLDKQFTIHLSYAELLHIAKLSYCHEGGAQWPQEQGRIYRKVARSFPGVDLEHEMRAFNPVSYTFDGR